MEHLLARCCNQTLLLKRGADVIKSTLSSAAISLTDLRKYADAFLHHKELAYFKTLSFEKRQHSYLLGRLLAKQAITQYEKYISLTDILIDFGVFHYPVASYPGRNTLRVSFSHCREWAVALAFPDSHPMGIDIELIDAKKNSVIATQLTDEEINLITAFNKSPQEKTFMIFWTAKEALSKILRTGLTVSTDFFAIKKITQINNYCISEFKNFMQYQAYSFQIDLYMVSIVYPQQTTLIMPLRV